MDDLPVLKYRWGCDFFHTPFRYGIGVEIHFWGRFLVGGRIGSLWFSWGQQTVFDSTSVGTVAFTAVAPSPKVEKVVFARQFAELLGRADKMRGREKFKR